MAEYLKMADEFNDSLCEYDIDMDSDKRVEYALHAIKHHDSLVAEIDRLRAVIDEVFNVASADYILASAGDFGDGRRTSSSTVMTSINDKMGGEYEEKMTEAINSKRANKCQN